MEGVEPSANQRAFATMLMRMLQKEGEGGMRMRTGPGRK